MGDKGDLYLTNYGAPFHQHLLPENWYEEPWFSQKRQRLEGTGDERGRNKGARRVMHQHAGRAVVRQRLETGAYALLPCRATGHGRTQPRLGHTGRGDGCIVERAVVGMDDRLQHRVGGAGRQRLQGAGENGKTGDGPVLLRQALAGTHAPSGGDDDDGIRGKGHGGLRPGQSSEFRRSCRLLR